MALRLMTEADDDAVRLLALPTKSAAQALKLLPSSTIELPSVGGRAEAIVMERLGADWLLFAAADAPARIPAVYAQGDGILALTLCHDALVQFACAQLIAIGFLQQLIPSTVRMLDQQVTRVVDWETRKADYAAQGYAALALLRRPTPVPHRRFISPAAGASGQLHHVVRPHQPELRRHRSWGWSATPGAPYPYDDDCNW